MNRTVRIVDARLQFDVTSGLLTQQQIRDAVSALAVELHTMDQMGVSGTRNCCTCGGLDHSVVFRGYDMVLPDGVPIFNDEAARATILGYPQPTYPTPEPPSIWRRLLAGFTNRRA